MSGPEAESLIARTHRRFLSFEHAFRSLTFSAPPLPSRHSMCTDGVFARGFNESLRMQRTSTLTEDGDVCDFRFYSPGETSGNSDESRVT